MDIWYGEESMAIRQSLATDKQLLTKAQCIVLNPMRSRAVFYHEDEGARRADLFVRQSAGHTRIDDLLQRTKEGQELLHLLGEKPWANKEEIWWELSRGLARAASGDVQCFGPARLSRNQPVSTHRSVFTPNAYAHTVFEKVELPELENNIRVETIYYNGSPMR
jgi:hypothetical protein